MRKRLAAAALGLLLSSSPAWASRSFVISGIAPKGSGVEISVTFDGGGTTYPVDLTLNVVGGPSIPLGYVGGVSGQTYTIKLDPAAHGISPGQTASIYGRWDTVGHQWGMSGRPSGEVTFPELARLATRSVEATNRGARVHLEITGLSGPAALVLHRASTSTDLGEVALLAGGKTTIELDYRALGLEPGETAIIGLKGVALDRAGSALLPTRAPPSAAAWAKRTGAVARPGDDRALRPVVEPAPRPAAKQRKPGRATLRPAAATTTTAAPGRAPATSEAATAPLIGAEPAARWTARRQTLLGSGRKPPAAGQPKPRRSR